MPTLDPSSVFSFVPEASASGGFECLWTVPADLPYFAGHFPNHPVLPAVAMIDATQEIVRRALHRDQLPLTAIKSAKFLAPIGPGQKLRILLSPPLPTSNTWLATWYGDES